MKLTYKLTLLILLLSGCSTKMAYNYLDWAIEWKVRNFISLDRAQKQQTKLITKSFHRWHRQTQLNQYANYLQSIKVRLDLGPVTAQEVRKETSNVQKLIDQSLDQVIPEIVNFLFGLSNSQVQELLDSYQKEREEYTQKYASIPLAKQEQNRYKELVDFLTPWLGPLSANQKQQITAWSKALEPYEKLNVKQQIYWEEQLKITLESRKDKDVLSAGIKKLMYLHSNDWNPKIATTFEDNKELTYTLLASMANNLSPKQNLKLRKKLDYYIDTCRELSNNP